MQFDYRYIWKMSYPILISMLMQQLIGITDVIYLGRLSETDLGASALGSTYFFTVFMIAFGFSMGAQIIMARRNGEGEFWRIGEVLYQGCSFLIAASLGVILLSKWFSPLLLSALIENKAIYAATLEYVEWRIWGLLSTSLIVMARAFFVSITKTFVLTIVSFVMVLANIVLNYILIFGKFGFPEMGIAGAAVASVIAELIAIAVYIFYFLLNINLERYGLKVFVYRNFKLLWSILQVSVWTMLQQFVSISTWFLFFVAIEHLGERELAISNIVRSLSSFPYVVVNALAATVSSITSNLIGQHQEASVLDTCRRVMVLCAAIALPLLLIMAVFSYPLLRVYTDNLNLVKSSYLSYIVMLTAFIPLIPAWILFNAVSGTGNTRYAMFIEFAAMVGYVIHIVVVTISLKARLPICWTADWVYNLIILVLSYKYMYSGKWRGKQI